MIVYKYCNSNIENRILSGSVKLSSLGYFRNLERQKIGDANEGTDLRIVNYELSGKGVGPSIRYPDGIEIGTVVSHSDHLKVSISNLRAIDQTDALIYSATKVRDDGYWCDGIENPYDTCIKIKDINKLASLLQIEIKKLWPSHYTDYKILECEYADITTENYQKPLSADPFRKDVRFAKQEEIRIAFFFNSPLPADELIVNVNPVDLFSIP